MENNARAENTRVCALLAPHSTIPTDCFVQRRRGLRGAPGDWRTMRDFSSRYLLMLPPTIMRSAPNSICMYLPKREELLLRTCAQHAAPIHVRHAPRLSP